MNENFFGLVKPCMKYMDGNGGMRDYTQEDWDAGRLFVLDTHTGGDWWSEEGRKEAKRREALLVDKLHPNTQLKLTDWQREGLFI